MKLILDPWKHILLEDFLNQEDFIKIRNISKVSSNEIRDDKYRLVASYDIKGNKLGLTGRNAYPLMLEGLFESYYEECLSILAFLDPSKIPYVERINFEIQSVMPNYGYRIHHDSLSKLLSIVIYLDPDNNFGTFIHKDENSEGKEIPWCLNSGIAFSAIGHHTWHSFKSNNERRATFNINLYNGTLND